VVKDSGLIHSVVVTAANVHDLSPAAKLLHGDEKVVYGDAGYQGLAKRPETANKTTQFNLAIRPNKRRVLPDTPKGHGQEPLQDQCTGSLDESVRGNMNMVIVCPVELIEPPEPPNYEEE